MELNDWCGANTYHYRQFSVPKLVKIKRSKGLKISLCFPTLNESLTVGKILRISNEKLLEAGLVDEIVVIDSGSSDDTSEIARSLGAKVYYHAEILPEYGSYKGKGEALWKSLYVLKGDLIIWCDSDIKNFASRFVYGLIGPMLIKDDVLYVKAFYQRPLKIKSSYIKGEGGRVTKILIRPLINLFYPELANVFQPLSGEYAGRRAIFEQIPFFTGYGVETGMLIDIYERFGISSIAQVNMIRRVHRNHPLQALSMMSFGILQAVFKKLEEYNKIEITTELSTIYNKIAFYKKECMVSRSHIVEVMRPPIIDIIDYRKRFKVEEEIGLPGKGSV